MKRLFIFLCLPALISIAAITSGCDDDDPVTPDPTEKDYFPFNRGAVWTYHTNVYKGTVGPDATVEVKIDTSWSSDQLFDFLMIRMPPQYPDWGRIIGLLDSAGVIYSLGDHPREGEFPLFKHVYDENEITHETITVLGTTYETVKYELSVDGGRKVTWWFADDIGLVREHSMTGISLFSDDNDDEVLTELISYAQ
ncbi:hypothetical protein KQI65_16265 [bacterium]|nr:hypothetical protein [bacterium]